MLIVLDKDCEVHLFASITEAQRELEAIDVENLEFEFCDDRGQRFRPQITSPVTAFRAGAFALHPDGSPDKVLPLSILARAVHLGTRSGHIKSLGDLKSHLERFTA